MALTRITERCRTLTAAQTLRRLAENRFHSARTEEVIIPVIDDISRRIAILRFHFSLNGSSQEEPADKTSTCHHGYDIRFDALSSR